MLHIDSYPKVLGLSQRGCPGKSCPHRCTAAVCSLNHKLYLAHGYHQIVERGPAFRYFILFEVTYCAHYFTYLVDLFHLKTPNHLKATSTKPSLGWQLGLQPRVCKIHSNQIYLPQSIRFGDAPHEQQGQISKCSQKCSNSL